MKDLKSKLINAHNKGYSGNETVNLTLDRDEMKSLIGFLNRDDFNQELCNKFFILANEKFIGNDKCMRLSSDELKAISIALFSLPGVDVQETIEARREWKEEIKRKMKELDDEIENFKGDK